MFFFLLSIFSLALGIALKYFVKEANEEIKLLEERMKTNNKASRYNEGLGYRRRQHVMSEYQFIKDYKDIEKYRLSFNRLANQIFGIDFERWFQNGCWNDRYICYSFLHNEKVIANLSVSLMDMILHQQEYLAVQIGTVMTDPEYRNQGLSGKLMRMIMEEYREKRSFLYLYANKSVINFYTKFGFKKVVEPSYSYDLSLSKANRTRTRKLNISSKTDWNLLMELNSSRMPVSRKYGIMNANGIFAWHCLNIFYDDIYLLENCNMAVIYQRQGDILHLYDVVSAGKVRLNELMEELVPREDGVHRVMIHFHPGEHDQRIDKFYSEPVDTLFVYPINLMCEEIFSDMKLPKIAQA